MMLKYSFDSSTDQSHWLKQSSDKPPLGISAFNNIKKGH